MSGTAGADHDGPGSDGRDGAGEEPGTAPAQKLDASAVSFGGPEISFEKVTVPDPLIVNVPPSWRGLPTGAQSAPRSWTSGTVALKPMTATVRCCFGGTIRKASSPYLGDERPVRVVLDADGGPLVASRDDEQEGGRDEESAGRQSHHDGPGSDGAGDGGTSISIAGSSASVTSRRTWKPRSCTHAEVPWRARPLGSASVVVWGCSRS